MTFEQAYQDEANQDALDRAAHALFRAAGRPDTLWTTLTEHEKTGWRHCVTVTLNAYRSDPKED